MLRCAKRCRVHIVERALPRRGHPPRGPRTCHARALQRRSKFRGYLGQANGGGRHHLPPPVRSPPPPGNPKCPTGKWRPLVLYKHLGGPSKNLSAQLGALGTSRRGRAERRRVPAVVRSLLPPRARRPPRAAPPPRGAPPSARSPPTADRPPARAPDGVAATVAAPRAPVEARRGPSRPVAAGRGRSRRPRGGPGASSAADPAHRRNAEPAWGAAEERARGRVTPRPWR